MSKPNISNPHDKLFRASMQYPEVARDFLNAHLPLAIKNKIALTSIITCQNTFIDEELKLTQSDVLLKAKIAGDDAYIYVLAEHQSKPDPIMPFRLLKYMIKIWDYHQAHAKNKNGLPFPVIFPMVFYTGKPTYNTALAIWELCGEQASLMHKILKEPFCLIDLNQATTKELTSRLWSGTMEFIMRHRFRQHLSQEIEFIATNINRLIMEKEAQFVLQLLHYILAVDAEHRSAPELAAMIRSKLPPPAGDEIMGLADILREEGRQQGMQTGRQEGMQAGIQEVAKKLLAAGTDPVFVAKNTGLTLDTIKQLHRSIKNKKSD